jgi:hypothetical protein
MIVPRYWVEASLQGNVGSRPITVRRYGWSDVGKAEAKELAEKRAGEALARIRSGEKLRRTDPITAYNGADGVPIREEIVSEQGDTRITRNGYGALCLNSPNVLFADIDLPEPQNQRLRFLVMGVVVVAAIVVGWLTSSRNTGLFTAFFGMIVARLLLPSIERLAGKAEKDAEGAAMERIGEFAESHPDWRLGVYRTPAGFRIMALHRLFDPLEPDVVSFFEAMEGDPVYTRMCLNQRCFRARVSPKPWRIGTERLIPRAARWPVASEYLENRRRWVSRYEAESENYASCRFIRELGKGPLDPGVEAVQRLHDQLTRCRSDLPIA